MAPPGSTIPGILQARTLEWVAISFSNAWKWKVKVNLLSKCPTLRDPMDCSLPGSSLHGIFQARVLEWGAIAFSISKQMTSQIWNPRITRLNWISTSLLETRKPEHGEFAVHRAHLTSAGLGRAECHVGGGELRILGVLKGSCGQGWVRMQLWPVQPHN